MTKPKHEPPELKGLRYKPVESDEADIAPELKGLRFVRVEEPVDAATLTQRSVKATKQGTHRLAKKK